MTSSLASQLSNIRSLNAERLTSSSALVKHTSYLFPPKTAAQQDLYTVHALGTSGWNELCSQDSSLSQSQASHVLFSEESRTTDRLMLPKEENETIDLAVSEFLQRMGSVLLSKGASKCLEWLVRRFSINEFNVQPVLAAFLPYHDTPQFARMLSICKIQGQPHLQFLLPIKKASSPLPASVLQAALLAPTNTTASLDLLKWIAAMVNAQKPSASNVSPPHRTLVNFWTSTLVQMCMRWSKQDKEQLAGGLSRSSANKKKSVKAKAADAQSILTVLLPAAVQVAGSRNLGSEAQVGGFMLLCSIATSFPLNKEAIQGIFGSLSKAMAAKDSTQATANPTVLRALLAAGYTLCSSPESSADPLALAAQASDRLVPDSIAQSLVAIDGLVHMIHKTSQHHNIEPFLTHFLSALVVRLADESAASCLESLLLLSTMPQGLVSKTAKLLLQLPLSDTQADNAFVKHLEPKQLPSARSNRIKVLSTIRQQKPFLFDEAVQATTSNPPSSQNAEAHLVWNLFRSVMAVEAGASIDKAANGNIDNDTNVLWLAIHSADQAQRNLALQQLLDQVELQKVNPKDRIVVDAIKSAILDSSKRVLPTLYSKPQVILKSLDPLALLETIVQAIHVDSLSPSLVAHHLRFLLVAYIPAHKQHSDAVLRRAFWPRLLWSSTSRGVAQAVASVVAVSGSETSDTVAAMLEGVSIAGRDASIDSTSANEAIALHFARQISQIKEKASYNAWIGFLVSQAAGVEYRGESSQLSHGANTLASLVLIQLLPLLEGGPRFVPLAQTIIDQAIVTSFGATQASDAADEFADVALQEALKGELSNHVLAAADKHPGSVTTMRILAGQLLLKISCKARIPSFSNFLASAAHDNDPAISLLLSVYAIVNSTPSIGASLSKLLLQTLFIRLRDSALPFLASVWTAPKSKFSSAVRLASIHHASAFLKAYLAEKEAKDFQTIVPSLLVALADPEASVRIAALSALDDILAISKAAVEAKQKDTDIFGFDILYGNASSELQYLDLPTLVTYLGEINQRAQGFRNDAFFSIQLHKDLLNVAKQDGRKQANHKNSLVCFLLSHIVCWPSTPIKLALLEAIQGVRNSSKLTMLHPLIRQLVQGLDSATAKLASIEERQRYVELLFASYDETCRSVIEDSSNGTWKLYLDALTGGDSRNVQIPAVKAIHYGGLFTVLQQPMRQQVYRHLAAVIADPSLPSSSEAQACLRELNVDAAILVPVLSELRIAITDKALDAPDAKRARNALGSDETIRHSSSVLVTILESATGKTFALTGSLVFELFEVLRLAVELHGVASINSEYILQLSMTCLANLLDKVGSDLPADVLQSLRADTIVNAIKSSSNPQTFQHALLLLSRVANIAPETVLHNVMPIFTFVGSTVLQRDDAFSFTVVERVLKSILPALVRSLKQRQGAASNHFALLQQARAFIRIFTDAATHVPKHRRQIFFKLLVDTMGQQEFCAAICMLLVDRSVHKIAKQARQDLEETLQLPLAVIQGQTGLVQVQGLNQIWDEAFRIWESRDNVETLSNHVFLDRAGRMTKEHVDNQTEPIRQIQALIMFVRQVLASKTFSSQIADTKPAIVGQQLEAFVRSAMLASEPQSLNHVSINAVAKEALNAVMPFVPVENVMNVVSALIQDSDLGRQTSGFSLFASRVSLMEADRDDRNLIASSFTASVVGVALKALQTSAGPEANADNALRQAVLDAIKAISSSAVAVEHGPLASTIPVLISLGKATTIPPTSQISVFSITRRLADRLGPRLIPHIANLVPFCLAMVNRSSVDGAATGATNVSSLRTGAFDTMTGLFGSVPTFMTKYIGEIVQASISPELKSAMASLSGSSTASERSLNLLLSTMIKRTPAQQMLDAVFKLWDELSSDVVRSGQPKLIGLFDFLSRALRQADRSAIASSYKSVYRFVVEALDLRRLQHGQTLPSRLATDEVSEIEDHAIKAFVRMVLKLNETSFRPLFLRMFDWAVLDLIEEDTPSNDPGLIARQVVLYKTFNALSDQLKSLVSGYYSVLLDHTVELLNDFGRGKMTHSEDARQLWDLVVASISKSARYDEGGFWNPARVNKLLPSLVSQLNLVATTTTTSLSVEEAAFTDVYTKLVAALVKQVADEATLKTVNGSFLTKASSSSGRVVDPRIRTAALATLTAVWDREGEAMLGFVPETVAQLSELLDDDEYTVAQQANRLREKIEVALGESLDSYLN